MMIRDADEALLEKYVPEALEQYFCNKLRHLERGEIRARIVECLKALSLMHLSPGNILFSRDIDDIWHYWILQTSEYEVLCRQLPSGKILHHSSMDYPPTRDASSAQAVKHTVNRFISFFALYVHRFGGVSEERLKYWPALESFMRANGWDLDRANAFLETKCDELEAALEQSGVSAEELLGVEPPRSREPAIAIAVDAPGAAPGARRPEAPMSPAPEAGTGRTYDIIDADGHVLEPLDLWDEYMDPAYRDHAPRLFVDTDGKERMRLEGKVLGTGGGLGVTGAIGARQGTVGRQIFKYLDGRRGGFDPHARIVDMDLDDIDAAFLYPSLGLFFGAVSDPRLAAALCRAYNRWLADYCRPYPDRLFGVAMLPLQSVELAIEEMRYARRDLGMRAAFLRPNPYNDKMLHHPDYEPFWTVAEELDVAIGLHGGTSSGMRTVEVVDRFEGRSARHIVSSTMEMMLACLSVVWCGVCERHPRVRIAFLEAGGGWITPWLDRMERHFDDRGFNDSKLSTRPTELFQRNCWISFEPIERSLGVLADHIGPHKILWATDYPHSDGFFPGAPEMIAGRSELSAETRRQILAGGAKGFYGLR